jgi:hypothetical protein
MQATWHLKQVGETDSESEVLEMINRRRGSVVLRRDGRFVVHEPATKKNADITLVYDTDTRHHLDDFTIAVYAVYRPNTAAAFLRLFSFASAAVVTYEELHEHARTVPETEPTVVSD